MRNLYGTKKEEYLKKRKLSSVLSGIVGAIGIMVSFAAFFLLFFLSAKGALSLDSTLIFVSTGLIGVAMTFVGLLLEKAYGSEK